MPDQRARFQRLTAPRTVAFGALWNLGGRLGPLLVAIAVTPFLLERLGVSRFGVFTLALSLVGMFSVFDFGFGRALTRLIASRLAAGEEDGAASAVVTGIALLAGLGTIGGAVMALLAKTYTEQWLNIPDGLRGEVLRALYVLCASAPLVIVNAALWGVLSAFQRFAAANLVNLPIMALYYLGPLAALLLLDDLAAAMAVLVLCRLAMTLGYWRICIGAMPALRHGRIVPAAILPVLRFGGWLTLSNLLWPVMQQVDRFVIAATLSAAAAAWYATPFDLILRFSIIPIAVMQTAFPAIATAHAAAPQAAARLFRLSTIAIAAILLPAAMIVVGFATPLLRLWLGADFAGHAAGVLVLLGMGVLFMCADTVPVALLDGIGRPEANAGLDAALLLAYLPALFALIAAYGIEGAAAAWTARVILAYALRLLLAARLMPGMGAELRRVVPMLAVAICMLALLPLHPAAALALPVFAASLWWRGLTAQERGSLTALWPSRQP